MNIQKHINGIMQKHFFDRMGGVKVLIVYPTDEKTKELNFGNVPGSVEAHLANFGKYQFGSSINNSVYRPTIHKTACEEMKEDEQAYAQANGLNYNGFVIVEAGGCSFETKARNIEHMGGQVALIVA